MLEIVSSAILQTGLVEPPESLDDVFQRSQHRTNHSGFVLIVMKKMVTAIQMRKMIGEGETTAVALVSAAFEKIADDNDDLKAWAWLDRDGALASAEELDSLCKSGRQIGPLHGVPIGLKDIIDTATMPTACGSAALDGRQPESDAFLVSRLRGSGAIVIGKTTTTAFAFMDPTETHNPHNHAYSPGGSSAGSAAAVAAGHVPVAIGTQTNGSVIRPASFCGVYAVKPSFGMISRGGVLRTSQTFDQVGVFANKLEDLALVTDVLADFDPLDEGCFWRPRPKLCTGLRSPRSQDPHFAWFEMPYFDRLAPDAHAGLMDIVARLGNRVEQVTPLISFAELIEAHSVIQNYEIPRNLDRIRQDYGDIFPPELGKLVAHGATISDKAYEKAQQCRAAGIDYFASFFDSFDAVLTPAALGEAPLFSDSTTGNPICSTVWTLAGLPCVTLPLMTSANAMPIGVQLVGNVERDDKLFGAAKWLCHYLGQK